MKPHDQWQTNVTSSAFPALSQASGFKLKDSHGDWHNESEQTLASFLVESLNFCFAMLDFTEREIEWIVNKPPKADKARAKPKAQARSGHAGISNSFLAQQ